MAKTDKTEKNTLKTQASKTPCSKADLIEVTDVEKADGDDQLPARDWWVVRKARH